MAHCSNQAVAVTRAFFDERAEKWDAMISAQHAVRLRQIIETLPIASDAHILDVGCGTGVLFPILADILDTQGLVVAADVSFAMLRETRARINALRQQRSLPAQLLLQADITHPPIHHSSFDWVICNSCFPHFLDQQGATTTMARLLRPKGALVICHTESRNAINELHRTVGGAVGGHELPDASEMARLVENAGLSLDTLTDEPDRYLLLAHRHA